MIGGYAARRKGRLGCGGIFGYTVGIAIRSLRCGGIDMLTKLTIGNFKGLADVEIELGSPVVFVGPNNSGKTSAMQALAFWDTGVKRWKERRSGRRPGRPAGI